MKNVSCQFLIFSYFSSNLFANYSPVTKIALSRLIISGVTRANCVQTSSGENMQINYSRVTAITPCRFIVTTLRSWRWYQINYINDDHYNRYRGEMEPGTVNASLSGLCSASTNQRPISRSCDHSRPIRGQCPVCVQGVPLQ